MGAAPQILGEAGDGDAPRYAIGDRNPVPLAKTSFGHVCGHTHTHTLNEPGLNGYRVSTPAATEAFLSGRGTWVTSRETLVDGH